MARIVLQSNKHSYVENIFSYRAKKRKPNENFLKISYENEFIVYTAANPKIRLFRPAVSYELTRQYFQNVWIIVLYFVFSPKSRVNENNGKWCEDTYKPMEKKSIIFKRCRWWWLCYRGWNCGVNSIYRE